MDINEITDKYLNEAKIKFQNNVNDIQFVDEKEPTTIPYHPEVLLAKTKDGKKMAMVSRKIDRYYTEDGDRNKNVFNYIIDLINYLNKNNFVYFEGFSRV